MGKHQMLQNARNQPVILITTGTQIGFYSANSNMLIRIITTLWVTTMVTWGASLDPEIIAKIDAFAEQIVACRNMVGMSVSAVMGGEMVYANGFGVIDKDSQRPVTSTTLFNIASASKQFTSTLLGKFLHENDISWDTPVRDLLGENFYFNDGLRSSHATMRDIGSHGTGQPRRDFVGYANNMDRHEAAFKTRFVKPINRFRDSYRYNNNMYDMMAYLTEVLSQESWEDTMRQHVFNPAGMSSSTFIHQVDPTREDLAVPYEYYQGGNRFVEHEVNSYWASLGGSGSLVSNAEDMAQWLKLLLAKGTLDGVEIIPEDVFEETFTGVNPMPQSRVDVYSKPISPETYSRNQYGLGWQIGWYRGYRMIQHSGGLYGYGALLTILPDMDIGVFLALNGADESYYGRRLLHLYVMDLLLGEEPWLNTTTACTFPAPWHSSAKVDDYLMTDDKPYIRKEYPKNVVNRPRSRDSLEPYEGVYGDFFYGNVTVRINEDTSKLMIYYGKLDPWELMSTEEENIFVGDGLGMTWCLALDLVQFSPPGPNGSETVLIDFDGSDPTLFTRGLTMEDAPPPPDPNSCDSATSSLK